MEDGRATLLSGFVGCAFLVVGIACTKPVPSTASASASASANVPVPASPSASAVASASASASPSASASASASAAPPTTDLHASFSLAKTKCKNPEMYGQCYDVTLSLHGAVERDMLVSKAEWGQVDCKVTNGGAGVLCDGPSGATSLDVRCDPRGACTVVARSVSDGYCPPPEDCSSSAVRYKFDVPAGTKLATVKR